MKRTHARAALKSDWACDQADGVAGATIHFGEEGGTGPITGSRLATNPGPCFPLDGTTENECIRTDRQHCWQCIVGSALRADVHPQTARKYIQEAKPSSELQAPRT